MSARQVIQEKEREFAFSDHQFRLLAERCNKQTGIVLAAHKKDMVYSRLVRRIRALKLSGFQEYCDLIEEDGGGEEIGHMVNAITTNLTSFFRESHHFDHLFQEVLAPLAAHPPEGKRLRLWSAGCSAGMEPYSMAMTMKAAIKNIGQWDAKILATDIDTNMLATGMAGEYVMEQYQNIPQGYRSDVTVLKSDERIRMADSLKQLIAFKQLNLLGNWPMKGSFDAIFCRNVVIYFDKPTQATLFDRMANLLKPGGWLYIGHSENLFKVCNRFELIGRTTYRKVR